MQARPYRSQLNLFAYYTRAWTRRLRATAGHGQLMAINVALVAASAVHPPTQAAAKSFWELFPTYVSALAASGALAVSATLFFRATTDRRREQASQVYANAERRAGRVVFKIENKSDLPVYGVRVRPLMRGDFIDDKMPGETYDLMPGRAQIVAWEPSLAGIRTGDIERQPWLTFIDASGHRWVRAGGTLKHIGTSKLRLEALARID